MILGKPVLSELAPYQQGKQTEEIKQAYGLDKIVKLSSNENPFGYSQKVDDLFARTAHAFHIYPDGHATHLRKEIADTLMIAEEKLVFGAGSDELIQLICRTFLSPDTNTVMAIPTFSQYQHHARIEGALIKAVPTTDGYHDLEQMLDAIDHQTRIVWICAPDNPTGTLISQDAFTRFMAACPSDVLVVMDEAYIEFVDPEKNLNTLAQLDAHPNLIVLRTFSKAYGLAGLRIGYGVMNERLAAHLNIVRAPFNTSSIAQQAAQFAYTDQAFIEQTTQQNRINKQAFLAFLDELRWAYYPTETNFVLIKTPRSGTALFDYLVQRGYIIRPGELLGYPNTIRVTIGLGEDMSTLQRLLTEYDGQLTKEGR